MEVMEAIRSRRSIRSYQDRMIEDDKLHLVLEAGRLAPSASNRQEWKFILVKEKEIKEKLVAAARGQIFIGEAPVVIVACARETEHTMLCGQKSYPIDVAIAVDHMTLKAVEEGLGTCWIGAFREDEVKEILNIPEEVRVVALLPIGYPQDIPGPTPRKSKDEMIVWEEWI
ncbi:MAG: nitroreductase family protein [Deltaproteobacteria bacterium]|nr:MAG: nitroreductase family protein [Deltaproteobacteria bacterium]